MTATDVPLDEGIVDFTTPHQPIRFRIDDDVFEALPEVPAITMLRFADDAERLEADDTPIDEKISIIQGLLRMVLTPESSTRLIRRLEDNVKPIGMSKFVDLIQWLLGRYGLRPTEPDSAS